MAKTFVNRKAAVCSVQRFVRPFLKIRTRKLPRLLLAAMAIILVYASPVLADSVATFALTGTFHQANDPSLKGSFSGSIIIDTTKGTVSSFSITDAYARFGGACDPVASHCYPIGPGPGGLLALNASNGSGGFPGDFLGLIVDQTTLVGIKTLTASTGFIPFDGFVDYSESSDLDCYRATCFADSLSITPAASAPEPGSLALLVTGLLIVMAGTRMEQVG